MHNGLFLNKNGDPPALLGMGDIYFPYASDAMWIDNYPADYTLLFFMNANILHESVAGGATRHDQDLIQAPP